MRNEPDPAHMGGVKPPQTLLAAAAIIFSVAACTPSAGSQAPSPVDPTVATEISSPAQAESAASGGTALALLETIEVKGRAPKTGYDREQFGQAWADIDRDGCDTRNGILARDLTDETFKPGTNDCVVLTGVLNDPFTATAINFVRGADTSSAVQIDHIIPLSLAWTTGAQQLDPKTRELFSNDGLNLLAVDGPSNGQKSDSDAASWLPKNKAFRCEYVALQTAVKAKYNLWVTAPEKDAIKRVLSTCPDQPVPTEGGAAGTINAQPATAPVEQPVDQPAGEVSYANCSAVRAAGAAPIRAGDPGFSEKFDGNGDGVGCE